MVPLPKRGEDSKDILSCHHRSWLTYIGDSERLSRIQLDISILRFTTHSDLIDSGRKCLAVSGGEYGQE